MTDGTWLYIGGNQGDPADSGQLLWRVEKLSAATGAPDTGFGSGGVLLIDPSPDADSLTDVAVGGGFLYLIGSDYTLGLGDSRWRIDKVSAGTGLPDAGFGTGGSVFSDPTTGWDTPRGIAIDSAYMYVAGDQDDQGTMRIEKRLLSDGTPDSGFGTGGAVTSTPFFGFNLLDDVVIDGTYMYVGGLAEESAGTFWEIYVDKRLLSSGALDTSFGSSGVVRSNPTSSDESALALILDGTALYVLGSDSGNAQWRAEKRNATDGLLDTMFGASGALTSNPSGFGFEEIYGGVVVGTNLYLGGSDFGFGGRWRLERHPK